MSKEDKFNVLIGIGIFVICIVIVILALMSAIKATENNDNVIYIDNGNGTFLSVPKSNLITQKVNIKKDLSGPNGTLHIDVKLPCININTDATKAINDQIYQKYQYLYKYATEITEDTSIKLDYSYDYLDKEGILNIVINEKRSNETGNKLLKEIKYTYNVLNDEIVTDG